MLLVSKMFYITKAFSFPILKSFPAPQQGKKSSSFKERSSSRLGVSPVSVDCKKSQRNVWGKVRRV